MDNDPHEFDEDIFSEAQNLMQEHFPEMIKIYLEDADIYLQKIENGFKNNDKIIVAQYAHPLKSASAGLGMLALSQIAGDLEHGAKQALEQDGPINHLEHLLPKARIAYQHASKKMAQYS